jgi:hypothetical protein
MDILLSSIFCRCLSIQRQRHASLGGPSGSSAIERKAMAISLRI